MCTELVVEKFLFMYEVSIFCMYLYKILCIEWKALDSSKLIHMWFYTSLRLESNDVVIVLLACIGCSNWSLNRGVKTKHTTTCYQAKTQTKTCRMSFDFWCIDIFDSHFPFIHFMLIFTLYNIPEVFQKNLLTFLASKPFFNRYPFKVIKTIFRQKSISNK